MSKFPVFCIAALMVFYACSPQRAVEEGNEVSPQPRAADHQQDSRLAFQTATFSMGWFWGPDAQFGQMPGIIRTRVGYAGGTTADPTYHSIGDHSETIQIDFDPALISYGQLLEVFWSAHNPGTPSFSRQYRSAILFHNEEQQRLAGESKKRQQDKGRIYTEIAPLSDFYPAEDYHQKYYLRSVNILMEELRRLYKTEETFVASTIAARLNGYVGGYGTLEQLEAELESYGLTEEAERFIRDRVSRR